MWEFIFEVCDECLFHGPWSFSFGQVKNFSALTTLYMMYMLFSGCGEIVLLTFLIRFSTFLNGLFDAIFSILVFKLEYWRFKACGSRILPVGYIQPATWNIKKIDLKIGKKNGSYIIS